MWLSVLEAENLRLGSPICSASDESIMADGITTAGALAEEITWQGRKPEGFGVRLTLLITTHSHVN